MGSGKEIRCTAGMVPTACGEAQTTTCSSAMEGMMSCMGQRELRRDIMLTLASLPGADQLHGGSGNDLLNGDGGNDLLWGDAGADTFQFDAPSTVTGAYNTQVQITPGDDVVKDFHGSEGDKLDFGGQGIRSAPRRQETLTSRSQIMGP